MRCCIVSQNRILIREEHALATLAPFFITATCQFMFTMMVNKSASSSLSAAVHDSSGTTRFVASSSLRSSRAILSFLLLLTFPLNVFCQEGGVTSTFIVLKEQVDFSALVATPESDEEVERRRMLLQELAWSTQKPITDCFNKLGITYRSYWITNAIAADLPGEAFSCDNGSYSFEGVVDEHSAGAGGGRRRRQLHGSSSDDILLAVEDSPRDGSAQFQQEAYNHYLQKGEKPQSSSVKSVTDEEELEDEELLLLFDEHDHKAAGKRHLSPKAARKSSKSTKKGKATKKKCWEEERNNVPYSLDNKALRGDVETQVSWIGADFVWGTNRTEPAIVSGVEVPATFGEGRVVAIMDTGVHYKHPTLINAYRGTCRDKDGNFTFDHNYNWYDPTPHASPEPVEAPNGSYHGTHVAGLAVGGYENPIGVAPGAKFISCRAFDDDLKFTVEALTRCYQFLYAPHDLEGNNPDVSLRPHVVTMSYECIDCEREEIFFSMNSLLYAGVAVVASAQNGGFDCLTVENPPGNLENVISIGALRNHSDVVSFFSSRGPVWMGGSSFLLKPDVVAPGSNLISATEGDLYVRYSGTSMSTGVAAGGYVLFSNFCPELYFRNIFQSWRVIKLTAKRQKAAQCTAPNPASPNNLYGFGTMDMKRAVRAAVALCERYRLELLAAEAAESGDSSN